MIIETTRLFVREFKPEDLEDFCRLNGDQEIMRFIRQPKSREESAIFFSQVINDYERVPGLGRWALMEKPSRKFIGMFSLLKLDGTEDVHIGYALLKNYWKMGYAAEIVTAGLSYAYEVLKLKSVVAITYQENYPSQKVLLKNDFEYESIFREGEHENFLYRHKNIGFETFAY